MNNVFFVFIFSKKKTIPTIQNRLNGRLVKSYVAVEPSWRCFTGWCIPSFCKDRLIINKSSANQDTRRFYNKLSQTHTLYIRSLEDTRVPRRTKIKNRIDRGSETSFNCSLYELIFRRMEEGDCFISEGSLWLAGVACMFLVYVEAQWHTWRVTWVTWEKCASSQTRHSLAFPQGTRLSTVKSSLFAVSLVR